MRIAKLLELSVAAGASDLHVSAGLPPLIRVDGALARMDAAPVSAEEALALVTEPMDATQRAAFEQCREADLAYETASGRFRINAFHHERGAGAAFRAIPADVPSLASLGLGPIFEQIADAENGLALVTGPTGSGKSTTVAALIDHINRHRQAHILTIEDPIEFLHESRECLVTQRQVHRHTTSFDAALKAALREDPDVILVGELRDPETIRLALTAAETGHLVFGTLHTQSAPNTVARIVDAFPADERHAVRAAVSQLLQAVVAQTLLLREGGGRVAAHEVMIATPAIRNLIREDQPAQMASAIQTGAAWGMYTLEQCRRDLARRGLIATDADSEHGKRRP